MKSFHVMVPFFPALSYASPQLVISVTCVHVLVSICGWMVWGQVSTRESTCMLPWDHGPSNLFMVPQLCYHLHVSCSSGCSAHFLHNPFRPTKPLGYSHDPQCFASHPPPYPTYFSPAANPYMHADEDCVVLSWPPRRLLLKGALLSSFFWR